MPNSLARLYVHFVWATYDRLPTITPEIEANIHGAIYKKARELGCLAVEVNGVVDHVHVLVKLPVDMTVMRLAREMKGVSSHLVNSVLIPKSRRKFRWQGSYGAFTVEPERAREVRDYVRNQKRHHAQATHHPKWERCADD